MRRTAAVAVLLAAGALLTGCGSAAASHPASSAAQEEGAVYQNPIVATGADPWVTLWQDHYYLVQSVSDRLEVTRSPARDLTGLADGESKVVFTPPAEGTHCKALWAPELHRIGDRWWIYYAATTCDGDNDHHRMFAAESTSDDPMSAFVDRGPVKDGNDRWAIDGTRIEWRGAAYFVWSGWPGSTNTVQNLYIARMTSPTRLAGDGVLISEADLPWERQGAPIEEGPEGLVHDGRLHVVYSASGSWTDHYALGMLTLTGTDPLQRSSWTKTQQPVFAGTKDVTSPGHASFTTSPDGTQDWIVYHSARYPGAGWDRVIDTQRFTFGSDGAPRFGRPVEPGKDLPVPSGQPR